MREYFPDAFRLSRPPGSGQRYLGLPAACVVALLLSVSEPGCAWAEVGRSPAALAQPCAACHGPNGQSQGGVPSLAARPADAIYHELVSFKSGVRASTIMSRIARGYSDSELAALAAYFGRKEEGK